MNTKRVILSLAVVLVFAVGVADVQLIASAGSSVDHSLYGDLLKKYVKKNGQVDYAGFKSEEAALDQYLNLLNSVDINSLPGPGVKNAK